MYLRTHLIDKLGIRPGDYLEGLEIIVDWFLSSTHYLPDEARQESERFWPRVREHGIQPDDFEMLRHIRRIRNRLGVLKHLKASGVEFEDARIEEWLEVRDSLL